MTDRYDGPVDGLTRYLRRIREFPLLGKEQERALAERWRDSRDPEALRLLVNSHLRLVAKMAMANRGYGLPVSELISEGNIGLLQAVERFDPDRGFRLSTYARWWIRAAIQDYILRNWSLVKLGTTAAQKRLFFNLRRIKQRLEELEQNDLSPESVAAIAEELGVPDDEVVQMNRRLSGHDHSLNAPLSEENEGSQWLDHLVDEQAEDQESRLAEHQERRLRHRMLKDAMKVLDPRERHILTERKLRDDPITLEGLSQQYSISRERVRQLEARAFEKVRKAMRAAAAGRESGRAVN